MPTRNHEIVPRVERHATRRVPTRFRRFPTPQAPDQARYPPETPNMPTNCGSPARASSRPGATWAAGLLRSRVRVLGLSRAPACESGPVVSMPSGHGAGRTVIAGCSSAVPSGRRHPECLVRAVEVEELRIPVSADPFAPFVVIGMPGVGHRVEKVCVAGPAAHVLRRARPCTFQAARRRRTGAGREDLFDHDLVLPGTPEVVLVDEPIALFRQGTEPWLAFIADGITKHRDIVWIGRAVADAADLTLMEMAV